MAKAFKCDACHEYVDGYSIIAKFTPFAFNEPVTEFELCPECLNDVMNVIKGEEPFAYCENVNGKCSLCGAILYDTPNYCQSCGAMVKEQ